MTPEELAAIKARYDKNRASHDAGLGTFRCCSGCRDADEIPALLAYVDELEEQGSKLTRELTEKTALIERLTAERDEALAKIERRRAELVAYSNDALNIRGILSPADRPFHGIGVPIGKTIAPAVEWLMTEWERATARIAELESRPTSAPPRLDPRTAPKGYPLGWTQHVLEDEARASVALDGETWSLPPAEAGITEGPEVAS